MDEGRGRRLRKSTRPKRYSPPEWEGQSKKRAKPMGDRRGRPKRGRGCEGLKGPTKRRRLEQPTDDGSNGAVGIEPVDAAQPEQMGVSDSESVRAVELRLGTPKAVVGGESPAILGKQTMGNGDVPSLPPKEKGPLVPESAGDGMVPGVLRGEVALWQDNMDGEDAFWERDAAAAVGAQGAAAGGSWNVPLPARDKLEHGVPNSEGGPLERDVDAYDVEGNEEEWVRHSAGLHDSGSREPCAAEYNAGEMNCACDFCGAKLWKGETIRTKDGHTTSKFCCRQGRLKDLAVCRDPPEVLRKLLETREFRNDIRSYNCATAFTSMGAKVETGRNMPGRGTYTFRVHGQVYHRLGRLRAEAGKVPAYGQLWVYDDDYDMLKHRVAFSELHAPQCKPEILLQLQQMLRECNPYVKQWKRAADMDVSGEKNTLELSFVETRLGKGSRGNAESDTGGMHPGTMNVPTVGEVAGIVPVGAGASALRDVIVMPAQGGEKEFCSLSELSPFYDPLQYPILFPYGDTGWHVGLAKKGKETPAEENGATAHAVIHNGIEEEVQPRGQAEEALVAEIEEEAEMPGDEAKESKTRYAECTALRFYAHKLQLRGDSGHYLHLGGKLMMQYIVDQWAKVEAMRLRWFEQHQDDIKANTYKGLEDAVARDALDETGKWIILPSTFYGGVRYENALYQDSLAMVREYGPPDLFITFTANPHWREIERAAKGMSGFECPVIMARAFELRLKKLMYDLTKKHILGKCKAGMYAVEYQKRGLPHAHILLILDEKCKPRTPEDYDHLVRAEIPDPAVESRLYERVAGHMMHACGTGVNPHAPCIVDGKCCKGYPKQFQECTVVGNGRAWPMYRRREQPWTVKRPKGVVLDNRHVVPYNPLLLLKHDAHINVEICASLGSVKYLFKYIYKGADHARVEISESDEEERPAVGVAGNAAVRNCVSRSETAGVAVGGAAAAEGQGIAGQNAEGNRVTRNEIKAYESARYISPVEAAFRLLSFPLHYRTCGVYRLPVHLPDEATVLYKTAAQAQKLVQAGPQMSMLEAYMDYYQRNPSAEKALYQDFPKRFWWSKADHMWKPRKQVRVAVGRIRFVQPAAKEVFYLRLLLTQVPGCASFDQLKTVDGVKCSSFREACVKRGFADDDSQWDLCLTEAAQSCSGRQMRKLFCLILLMGPPAAPEELWRKYQTALIDDFLHEYDLIQHTPHGEASPSDAARGMAEQRALKEVEEQLQMNGHSLKDEDLKRMPQVLAAAEEITGQLVEAELLRYDKQEQDELWRAQRETLNVHQLAAWNAIVGAFERKESKVFFIEGSGGTGKTYLYCALLAYVRSKSEVGIAVATSAVAALLLPGGRTAHSTFHIPLEIHEKSTCKLEGPTAELFRRCRFILWDEAGMCHRHNFEAVDRSLRKLRDSDCAFGGGIVVLGGDWKQILPVVKRAKPAEIVGATLKRSAFWAHVNILRLHRNMRVETGDADGLQKKEWAEYLEALGNGKQRAPADDAVARRLGRDAVRMPTGNVIEDGSLSKLMEFVFPNLADNYQSVPYLSERCIMTMRNQDVDRINWDLLGEIPGEVTVMRSYDSVLDPMDRKRYGVEVLNRLLPSGLPPHELHLKVGVPLMLLRNIDIGAGLCNGTRVILRRIMSHLLDVEIVTGTHVGSRALIPRMSVNSGAQDYTFVLVRRQFPVRLAFAMTANKAQGQTFRGCVGLYLPVHPFSHGQLYVAASRSDKSATFKVAIDAAGCGDDKSYTRNVVFRDVLT